MKNKLLYYTVLTTMSVCLPYYAYAESAPLCSGQGGSKDCNTLGFKWTSTQCGSNHKLPCPMDKSKYFCNGAVTKTCMDLGYIVEQGLECDHNDAVNLSDWGLTCYPKSCCDDGSGEYVGANDGHCRPTNCTVLGYLRGDRGWVDTGNLCESLGPEAIATTLATSDGFAYDTSCYPRTCCGNDWEVTAEGQCLPDACSTYNQEYTDDAGNCDYGVDDYKTVQLSTGNTTCYKCATTTSCEAQGYWSQVPDGYSCKQSAQGHYETIHVPGAGDCLVDCRETKWCSSTSERCGWERVSYSDDDFVCSTYSFSYDCTSFTSVAELSIPDTVSEIYDFAKYGQKVEVASISDQECYKRYVSNLSSAQDETDFEVYI